MNSLLIVGLVVLFLLFIYLLTLVHNHVYIPITTNIPDNLPIYTCIPDLPNPVTSEIENSQIAAPYQPIHHPNTYKLLNATVDPIEI